MSKTFTSSCLVPRPFCCSQSISAHMVRRKKYRLSLAIHLGYASNELTVKAWNKGCTGTEQYCLYAY